ncbi:class I SAM-dependent methyltransferase [Mucilaginibacter myungsuensis]|uniref:Class I SAM-dependent methyltransferase n=1 Tax=Mucilaginibacter myungsuensis TaxID=649104 RepID=A0A929PVP0_9SPHI|nr:class I SAM-dependent methyltransferase [Mucilaginibacter myungsuensis]MBE9660515.1 class I SAM-dependent methyltransferase [Mucilaginibacter myungsuensis]MDN3600559.1 class I SAM-dependent methyltransferase [Mucilaginibacter myungsuensis]
MNDLQQLYGNIDIYLFDQLLKGRFDGCRTILDVGCGGGRNLYYFLRNGFNVYGIDPDANAVKAVKQSAAELAPDLSPDNFTIATAENVPHGDETFDLVICSAVLHFARDHEHFDAMIRSIWRVLKPGGYLFARLASNIGIEELVRPLGNGRYLLPDGSTRYLADREKLLTYSVKLNGELFEPIKTTNVQDIRCMTTWCLQKN